MPLFNLSAISSSVNAELPILFYIVGWKHHQRVQRMLQGGIFPTPPSPFLYPQTSPDIHRCGQLRRQFPCWYQHAQQGMCSIAPLSHQIHCPHPQPHDIIGHISAELIVIKLDQLHKTKVHYPFLQALLMAATLSIDFAFYETKNS